VPFPHTLAPEQPLPPLLDHDFDAPVLCLLAYGRRSCRPLPLRIGV